MARKRANYRDTWKYRKKDPKYRKPIFMDVKEDLPMTRVILSDGTEISPLPKGRYEIRYRPHPDPTKRGDEYYWLTVQLNGVEIGAAKKFFENLQTQGLVSFLPLDTP